MAQTRRTIAGWVAVALAVCAALALRDVAKDMVQSQINWPLYLHTIGEEGPIWYYMGWAALTPFIFALARRVPVRRDHLFAPLAFHLGTSVIITAAARAVLTDLGAVYLAGVPWAKLPNLLTPFWTNYAAYRAVADTSIYWLILVAGFALHAYDEDQARERQAADLQRALVSAQVDALKMKLQPHFLFNTLNSISFLAVERDTDGLVAMVERLGGLLRSSIQSGGAHQVTVRQELSLLEQYLSIEEIRFSDRLRVVRCIDPRTLEALIPSLVLQPMIENSIKHGFSRRLDAGRLEIAIRREGEALVLTVEDDGPGLPPGWDLATHCGRGLKNVLERLDKLYPGAWRFTLENQPRGGAIATLRVPWQERVPAVA